MPQRFSKLGISFLYPDNWTLDEQATDDGTDSVTIYSPGGAFWSVSIHPVSADPQKLARAAADAMTEEYREVEREDYHQVVDGRELCGFDLAFYYLDLTNSAFVRCFRTSEASYAVFYQSEDRELRDLGQVFSAITKSLLESID